MNLKIKNGNTFEIYDHYSSPNGNKGSTKYVRVEYTDNTYLWKVPVFPGRILKEDVVKELEEAYQNHINKSVTTTNEKLKLSIEEFTILREGLYSLRKSQSPSAYQAKLIVSDDVYLTKFMDKLREFMV